MGRPPKSGRKLINPSKSYQISHNTCHQRQCANNLRASPCNLIWMSLNVAGYCRCLWSGDIHGLQRYKFIGLHATTTSHMPVSRSGPTLGER